MCLLVKAGTKPRVLKKDLVVFKLVIVYNGVIENSFYHANGKCTMYEPGETRTTTIGKSDNFSYCGEPALLQFVDLDGAPPVQYVAGASLSTADTMALMSFVEQQVIRGKIDMYGPGYHAFTTRKAAEELCGYPNKVYRFIIPAGSTAIFDNAGQVVASSIVYSPLKSK